jgi:hypothetical protein
MPNKNPNFVKPRLADLLNFLSDNILLNLNCHHLATIQSFNATKQTAVATVDYQKVIPVLSQETGVITNTLVAYPPLVDCPVYFPPNFTYPVKAGQKCMAMFNDRDMDVWFTGITGQAPNTARLHAFSDAVLFVGIRPPSAALQNFDNTRAMLRSDDGNTKVALSADQTKINIQNNAQNLATILQDLVSALEGLTVNTVTGIPNPPYVTNLAAIATRLGALLQ